ncbi:MAG TPA: hypothetical protein VM487_17265, partial [Phycisphaerae bacterium]|nr:hypothetical protein [Phycisphaerae bacterium]
QDTDRWRGQMKRQYTDLCEDEKDSDRKEADRVLALLPKPAPDAECERLAKWCDKEAKYFRTYGYPKRAKPYEETAAILRMMKRHLVEYENTPDGHTPLYVDGLDVSPGTRWGKTYLLMLRALLVRCGFEMAERKSEVKP